MRSVLCRLSATFSTAVLAGERGRRTSTAALNAPLIGDVLATSDRLASAR